MVSATIQKRWRWKSVVRVGSDAWSDDFIAVDAHSPLTAFAPPLSAASKHPKLEDLAGLKVRDARFPCRTPHKAAMIVTVTD